MFYRPALLLLLLASCGGSPEDSSAPGAEVVGTVGLPDAFYAEAAPASPVDVLDVRESPEIGAEVVVRGSVKDFVEGLAVFTLADDSLMDCAEMEDDHCETPWDFCCEDPDKLVSGVMTVEFHGDGGLLTDSVEGFHGIEHLSDVIVTGTLSQDEAQNLTLTASRIHRLK